MTASLMTVVVSPIVMATLCAAGGASVVAFTGTWFEGSLQRFAGDAERRQGPGRLTLRVVHQCRHDMTSGQRGLWCLLTGAIHG